MEERILLIDMDDVITTHGLLNLINEYMGTNYTYNDFKSFYMQDSIPNKEEFFKWFISQNMYENCNMSECCYETLEELNKFYKLFIATSYLFPEIARECGYILNQKFEYLNKNLPFIKPEQYIFISDKSILKAYARVDDRVDNLEGSEKKILFSAYHNLDISDEKLKEKGIERANNWVEVKEKLLVKK